MTDTPHNPKRRPVLGCIADDVTGATDLAINLVQGGMRVVQLLDIPTPDELNELDADAIVVALKTRSIAAAEAVNLSLSALTVMQEFGIQRFYFKYCSTFDSTENGNIGPVATALLDALDATQTVYCPAFPRAGRTVYQGHLFVNGKLLNESGMQNHPLNPMHDPDLVRFLGKQVDDSVGLLALNDISTKSASSRLNELSQQGYRHVVVDTCSDNDLPIIAEAVTDMPLVTGGSGLARFLPASYRGDGLCGPTEFKPELPSITGRSLIVSGSCSVMTNQQVAWMRKKCPCWAVDVQAVLANPAASQADLLNWAESTNEAKPLLVYSTAPPEQVAESQAERGNVATANALEDFLAAATLELVGRLGISRLILAGGETAGAVVDRLGIRSLRIGPEICAGVPWTEACVNAKPFALALKSGNFGQEDFFEHALGMLP